MQASAMVPRATIGQAPNLFRPATLQPKIKRTYFFLYTIVRCTSWSRSKSIIHPPADRH